MKDLSVEKEMLEDSEYSLSKVPSDKKTQGIWAAMVVLVGFTFFTPSMTAGGNLGIGLNFSDFFTAVVMGNAFLGVYCGTLAYIGQKTGLTLDLLGHHSFGNVGSYLPSALISFTQIGWFGVGVAMFAIPVSKMTGIPVWVLIIITGVVMTVTHMGLHVCQMMGYEEIMNSYKLVTHNAAKTLNLGDSYGIKEGNPASFIVLNNNNFYNVLNERSEILYNFNKGKLIATTTPAIKKILF